MKINKDEMKATLTIDEALKVNGFLGLIDASKRTKLTYAATQLSDELTTKLKPFNKAQARLTVDYAAKEENGTFKQPPKGDGYVLDPKKINEYNDKLDELRESMIIELDLYYCKDKELIEALPIPIIRALNGILFEYDFSELETAQN